MELEQSADGQAPDSTKSSEASEGWTLLGVLFIYAIVEAEFLHRLWVLVHSHSRLDYLSNAVAFQACFIGSAFMFRRCLRIWAAREEATGKAADFYSRMTAMVIMLLLSLMQFSSLTSFYYKVKP